MMKCMNGNVFFRNDQYLLMVLTLYPADSLTQIFLAKRIEYYRCAEQRD